MAPSTLLCFLYINNILLAGWHLVLFGLFCFLSLFSLTAATQADRRISLGAALEMDLLGYVITWVTWDHQIECLFSWD